MSRRLRILIILGVTAALPLAVLAQESGTPATRTNASSASVQCAPEFDPQAAAAPGYDWRVRTYTQLDCVVDMLDKALAAKSGSVVSLSRDDAERLRALAFSAKDAASRIER